MNFGDKIKVYRMENRVSQLKLADMLDVDRTTIVNWEKGKNQPNELNQFQILKILEGEQ